MPKDSLTLVRSYRCGNKLKLLRFLRIKLRESVRN